MQSRTCFTPAAFLVAAALISALASATAADRLDSEAQALRALRGEPAPASGPAPAAFAGHGGPVRAIAALAGGAIATGGFDSAIIVWSLQPAMARQVLRHHDSTVNALAALPDDCLASGGEDGRIAIWCGAGSEPRRVLAGHGAPVGALAVAPDASLLASAGWDHQVRVWPLPALLARGGEVSPRVLAGHQGPINGIAFLPDGNGLVSAGYDGQVRLTPLGDGNPRATTIDVPVNAVAVSPDGAIVTAAADGKLRFFDAGLALLGELDLGLGPLTTVALSPDGKLAATAGMRTPVTLVDVAAREARSQILGPGLPVWSVAFTGDGRELITGGADRAVRRWDPATGRPAGGDIAQAGEDASANDPHPGARVFRACRACHGLTAQDTNRAGPTLHGIFGRRIASAPGYAYSEALKRMDLAWNAETISKLFEVGPNAYLPGTKMPEQKITNPDDRRALVDWLATKTAP